MKCPLCDLELVKFWSPLMLAKHLVLVHSETNPDSRFFSFTFECGCGQRLTEDQLAFHLMQVAVPFDDEASIREHFLLGALKQLGE